MIRPFTRWVLFHRQDDALIISFSSQNIHFQTLAHHQSNTLLFTITRKIEMYVATNGFLLLGHRAKPCRVIRLFFVFCFYFFFFSLSNKRIARKWYKLKMKKKEQQKKVKIVKKEKMTGNDRVDIVGGNDDDGWCSLSALLRLGCSLIVSKSRVTTSKSVNAVIVTNFWSLWVHTTYIECQDQRDRVALKTAPMCGCMSANATRLLYTILI